jgi:hypothetical protein
VPVGCARQLWPDDFVAPWLDQTPGGAMVEQYSLSTTRLPFPIPARVMALN